MPVRNPLKNAKRVKGQIAFAKRQQILPRVNYLETELSAKRNTTRFALERMRSQLKQEWKSDPTTIPKMRKEMERLLKIKKKRKLNQFEQNFLNQIQRDIKFEIKVRNEKVKLPQ